MSEVNGKIELSAKTTQQLVRDVLANIKRAVIGVKRAALFVKELDKRQYDFASGDEKIPEATLNFLRKIYKGQLLPEFFLDWRDSPIWNHAKNLPLPIQRKIVENKPFEVVAIKEGQQGTVMVHPLDMTPAQARIVFDGDKVRNDRAQIAVLNSLRTEKAITKEKARPIPYEYDRKSKTLYIYEACSIKEKQLRSMLGE